MLAETAESPPRGVDPQTQYVYFLVSGKLTREHRPNVRKSRTWLGFIRFWPKSIPRICNDHRSRFLSRRLRRGPSLSGRVAKAAPWARVRFSPGCCVKTNTTFLLGQKTWAPSPLPRKACCVTGGKLSCTCSPLRISMRRKCVRSWSGRPKQFPRAGSPCFRRRGPRRPSRNSWRTLDQIRSQR